jgi:hypothetical protein
MKHFSKSITGKILQPIVFLFSCLFIIWTSVLPSFLSSFLAVLFQCVAKSSLIWCACTVFVLSYFILFWWDLFPFHDIWLECQMINHSDNQIKYDIELDHSVPFNFSA